jgi:oxalate---CoA ligase
MDMAGLLAVRAAHQGDAPAVLAPGRAPLTYAGLDAVVRAHRITLREWGVGRRDRVAIVLPDGYDTAVWAIATAANAVCVSLNPLLREPELLGLFERIRPCAVVVRSGDSAARRVAQGLGIGVLAVGAEAGRLDVVMPVPPPGGPVGDEQATEDDIGLVLATSGTTGRPKLVPLTHRNILAAAGATVRTHGLTKADRRLNFMPLYHVQGLVGSLTSALVAGASIVCTDGFQATKVPDWVRRWGATWYSATPTMHREILRECGPDVADLAGAGLRFLRAGSAALPSALRDEVESRFGLPVVESYGMTEAHQIASTPVDLTAHRPGTVGRPTGSNVLVLRQDGTGPASPGEVGEIVISGDNVFGGYLDDPEANAESFVDGWFRTGDIGLCDDAGYLVLRGRVKEIINRGGEKVSPKEVDDVLLGHPAVAEAVTFPVPDARLQEDVGVAVVVSDGHSVDERELRRFAARELAPFKVPRHVVFVDSVPRTPGGKIRRRALAELMGVGMTDVQRDVVAGSATGPTEAAIAEVWKEVLRLPSVNVDDDFFFLGGDSLTGASVLQKVGDVFGVELSPFSMYDEANTVRGMAALVLRSRVASR